MTTISALVHTLNEEANIEACLLCLRWCDEIVVVDMESEDHTGEIARRFTDRVLSVPKMGMADPARRMGVDATTGDWILVVDADELVPVDLAKELRAIAEEGRVDVVRIPFMNYLLGRWIRHTMWWPEFHPRFFRRGTVIPNERVHETYRFLSERVLTLPPQRQNCVWHFNYLNSNHFVQKMNSYTEHEAKAFKEMDGRSFSALRLFWRPTFEFMARFVYKRGFLDGWRGLFLSVYMAFYRFLAEAKLWETDHNAAPADAYAEIKRSLCEKHEETFGSPTD